MRDLINRRQEQVQERLNDNGFEGIILSLGANTGYLSGFQFEKQPYEVYLLLSSEKDPAFAVPKMMEEQVKNNSTVENVIAWSSNQYDSFYDIAESYFSRSDPDILLDDFAYYSHSKKLDEVLNTSNQSTEEILHKTKEKKFPEEINRLREAANITDQVLTEIRSQGEKIIGMTEKEVEDLIITKFRNKGGGKPAFSLTVAAGENGSEVLHEPGQHVIEKGDPVVFDIGTTYNSYLSDCARTIVFEGNPSEEFKEVFKIVQKAYNKALEQIQPGNTAGSVADTARNIIESEGYGDQYITSGGHGLGRSTSEPPYIKRGNETMLKPGMVLTLEPGIYIPEKFGTKIENTVLVTGEGYEVLNETAEDWRV